MTNTYKVLCAFLCLFLFPIQLAFAEDGVQLSCEEYEILLELAEVGSECPKCNTLERTEEVSIPFTETGPACTPTSCEHADTSQGERWRCEFEVDDPNGPGKIACTVSYARNADGTWGPGTVDRGCRDDGIGAPSETNPDLSDVPDLADKKDAALAKAGEFCKCRDTCDKINTCQIKEDYEPTVDEDEGNGGVTGTTTKPDSGATSVPRGCKGTVTIAIKVKCEGKCAKKQRYRGDPEPDPQPVS